MAKSPLDHIKKVIVRHLEKSVSSSVFDIRNLTIKSIKNVVNKPGNEISKALDELVNESEIQELNFKDKIYVPKSLVQHKNLKGYLKNPYEALFSYSFGVIFVMAFSQIYPLGALFDFSKPGNLLPNSIFIGLILPYVVGSIIYYLYNSIYKNLEKNDKQWLAIAAGSLSVSFLVYLALAGVFSLMIDPAGIMAAISLGAAITPLTKKMIFRSIDEGGKK